MSREDLIRELIKDTVQFQLYFQSSIEKGNLSVSEAVNFYNGLFERCKNIGVTVNGRGQIPKIDWEVSLEESKRIIEKIDKGLSHLKGTLGYHVDKLRWTE